MRRNTARALLILNAASAIMAGKLSDHENFEADDVRNVVGTAEELVDFVHENVGPLWPDVSPTTGEQLA